MPVAPARLHHHDVPWSPGGSLPREIIPNRVAAMLLFVACEIMFFLGLISAHLIASANEAAWPPAGQPRLPIATTTLNTLVLLASGVCLFLAQRTHARVPQPAGAPWLRWLTASVATGAFFLLAQGSEWLRLVHFGLTIRSSLYGSFFYLIVGAHALHALAALAILAGVWWSAHRGRFLTGWFQAAQVFWYFVVGIWPLIFAIVYLR